MQAQPERRRNENGNDLNITACQRNAEKYQYLAQRKLANGYSLW